MNKDFVRSHDSDDDARETAASGLVVKSSRPALGGYKRDAVFPAYSRLATQTRLSSPPGPRVASFRFATLKDRSGSRERRAESNVNSAKCLVQGLRTSDRLSAVTAGDESKAAC